MNQILPADFAPPPAPTSDLSVSDRRAWTTVGILFVLSIVSIFDRQIIAMAAGPMRADLHLGDFELSLLIGLAYGSFYVLFGIPLGWLVDRFPRRPIVMAGVAVWSVATAACGLVPGVAAVYVSRMFVGASEASLGPASYSLLGDIFPRRRIGLPMVLYNLGSPIGASLSLFAGGFLLDWAIHINGATLPLFGTLKPWQLVFVVIGLPGLLLSGLALLLADPPRRKRPDAVAGDPPAQLLGEYVRGNRALLALHFVAFGLTALVAVNITIWAPEYMRREFGWSFSQIGMGLSVVTLAAPLIAGPVTGVLTDRLYRAGVHDAPMRLFLFMLIIALPFSILAYAAHSPFIFLACFFLMFALIPAQGLAGTALQLIVPSAFKGRITGGYLTFVTILAMAVGPAAVGATTEFILKDGQKLGLALMMVVAFCLVVSIVSLACALAPMRRAVAAAAGDSSAG